LNDLDIEKKLNKIENNQEYYIFKLISKDFNLYRNINLLFYFESEDEQSNINAINEILWTT
jgi:hypothetical protein